MSANIGKRWTDGEEDQMLRRIRDGEGLEDIAIAHKRTVGGIKSRINKLAHIYLNEGMSDSDITKILGLDKYEIDVLKKGNLEKEVIIVNQLDKDHKINDENSGSSSSNDNSKSGGDIANVYYSKLDKKLDNMQRDIDNMQKMMNEMSDTLKILDKIYSVKQ